ncbi:TMV resistance protein N [Capsicum baccatum]|uniref:TMV resistance protein N n=1 Tax=Capsicum baccatum TaxID=33114 RepID=A0A2G2VDX5_CAPBA|nr:TMV resistance protein N [Capsicum baccatum]
MQTPDFSGMPNLENLYLGSCMNLKEVHHSLGNCRKLIHLSLDSCESLERFPCVSVESLEYLGLQKCYSLEKFPEIIGEVKPSSIQYLTQGELILSHMKNLVALPSSICKLKCLVKLNVSYCFKFESLPEEIGDLENLEELDAGRTLISRPPFSVVRLNKLKFLSFEKITPKDGVLFVFPRVNEGLRSLEILNLSFCNLIDGGLPEDIGCLHSLEELTLSRNNFDHFPQSIAQLGALRCLNLSHCEKINFELIMGMKNLETLNLSYCNLVDGELPDDIGCLSFLKKLDLCGNNFEHLPRSIEQLGALPCLDVTHCKRLTQLPEFPVQLDTIDTDWTNYRICNSLFQNISLLQHDISASDSSSLRVITGWQWQWQCYQNVEWSLIPHRMPRFPYQGIDGVSVNLLRNWYIHDSLLGFSVCYHGILTDITAHLIPLYDGMSCITRKLVLSDHSKYSLECYGIHFFLIPFAGLWDISKANGKTPNDYSHIMEITMNIALGQGGADLMIVNTMMKPVAPLLRNKGHVAATSFPQSIAQLGALRFLDLSHCKKINFELIVGMKNLEILNLSYCNLIDGELPNDIGCLSSLKRLNLSGNNFGHLPRSIAQLGALRCLDVSHCKRLTQLPELPVQLDTIEADWTNYWICNSLFQNISLLQHGISASDSLSLRVITGLQWHGMPTFPYEGIVGVPVFLPKNWYIHDSFLGFAVCCNGELTDVTAHLIPLSDDGMSCITRKLVFSKYLGYYGTHFFLIPFAGLWDISN